VLTVSTVSTGSTVSTVSTVLTVSTVIARCYLHLRWYFLKLLIEVLSLHCPPKKVRDTQDLIFKTPNRGPESPLPSQKSERPSEKIGKIWSCKECGKICQTEKRPVIHENVHKENHISNQQFHCEECPYRTIVKEYLVNHVRLIHKTDKSRMFLCTLGSWQVRQQAKILSQP